jgi:hypothetical protein
MTDLQAKSLVFGHDQGVLRREGHTDVDPKVLCQQALAFEQDPANAVDPIDVAYFNKGCLAAAAGGP